MITDVPVRVTMRAMTDVATAAAMATAHSTATVADVHSAAAVHPAATTVTASAGFRHAERRKAKRSNRGDGQKARLADH
jgi:hypothetical protein